MDVDLYIYDLSKGLARQYSVALTGTYLDAIYHTSLVFNGTEYLFGQGVQRTHPGSTHHGQPMKIVHQGRTELPMNVIEEYMESLAEIYTAESYDLFLHNCNNFTQDLSMFLVGKEIPHEIRTLPQKFLDTPFGRMMKPQIDAALRGVTQAPVMEKPRPSMPSSMSNASSSAPRNFSAVNGSNGYSNGSTGKPSLFDAPKFPSGVVHNVTTLRQVGDLLDSAKSSCAVIFFTSSTCAPCKIIYPAYDEIAQEAGSKAVLIKVDINQAYEVAQKYQVRATPTLMTFLRGQKDNEWLGASEPQLRGNVRMLLQMAYPPHPHISLRLPSFQMEKKPVLYKKIPPFDKLAAKIGPSAHQPPLSSLVTFSKTRFASTTPAASTSLPSDLSSLPSSIVEDLSSVPLESQFALIDLLRISFTDPRISGFLAAEDPTHTALLALLSRTSSALSAGESVPYNLHLCTLQLLCNLSSTHLYDSALLSSSSPLSEAAISITTSSLLSTNLTIIHTAAAMSFNLALSLHNLRFKSHQDPTFTPSSFNDPQLNPDAQVSLTASLIEALQNLPTNSTPPPPKSSPTTTTPAATFNAILLSLGLLIYGAEPESEVMDLCHAMGVKEVVEDFKKGGDEYKSVGGLIAEVGGML